MLAYIMIMIINICTAHFPPGLRAVAYTDTTLPSENCHIHLFLNRLAVGK